MADDLVQLSDTLFEVPKTGGMRVPGRIYATRELLETQKSDEAIQQVRNVAHMPGIVKYALAMPDFHWGYGMPIGGVAAFDLDDGVISPGSIGFDVNCGVRIIRTGLVLADVGDKLRDVVRQIYRDVPAGVGSEGAVPRLDREEGRRMLTEGAKWAVDRGFGTPDDLDCIEEGGRLDGADPDAVSDRAHQRGMTQLGTLGSGNHFLEIQVVEEAFDAAIAERLGLAPGTIALAIHSGSRGFGHQVCEDSLRIMERAVKQYGIALPDRQLACAPYRSPEGQRYWSAMACAANFAWNNRQIMQGIALRAVARVLKRKASELDARLVYDVCHNIAKVEEHRVDGGTKKLCVHRKGATRAFGPGDPRTPARYRDIGQPVFVPGDMGRASYVCLGTAKAMDETWGSSMHGAGRAHSRTAMLKSTKGRNLFKELEEERGVIVMARGHDSVAEEMPEAYKDVSLVVDTMDRAGISRKLVRLRPIGCVKG